ncbi:MAG: hypothetical protein KDE14_01770 [Rhodobacteraceae bacterium]|nr:hypothetical protein [Paracoccaceae bacterium]
MTYDRRRFIGSVGACALQADRAFAQSLPNLAVTIEYHGKEYSYTLQAGVDLGSFQSPIGGFVQGCWAAQRPDFPLVVHFRPDLDGERTEIVFEFGRLWGADPQHLEAYVAKIYRDSTVLATIQIPKHFWFSRWRWQSMPRPVVGDVSQLIKSHLLPPFGLSQHSISATNVQAPAASRKSQSASTAGGLPAAPQLTDAGKLLFGNPAPTERGKSLGIGASPQRTAAPKNEKRNANRFKYEIMGSAGLELYMPGTGERDDIGMVTGWQAQYIVSQAPADRDVIIAQAEAAGTIPWHMRDLETGAPIDLDVYSQATWYPDVAPSKNKIKTLASDFKVDSSHQPAVAYLPYLLTGDPYYLEELQFAANWNRGSLVPEYRLSIPQSRSFAWSLRTLSQAANVSPAEPPRWLLPKKYWVDLLERTRIWFQGEFVESDYPPRKIFRALRDPRGYDGITKPWQEDFVSSVMGWVILMGFESWLPQFKWQIDTQIARTSNKRGWPRAYATPYDLSLSPPGKVEWVSSWADAWSLNAEIYNYQVPTSDDWLVSEDKNYLQYTRGALVFIDMIGVEDVTDALAWSRGQLTNNWTVTPKWRL